MGRDLKRYCKYHKAKWHKTDYFRAIKCNINNLILKCLLENFVAKQREKLNASTTTIT